MSQYYDLNNTGPQVQDRLDQTQENKQDIATLEEKVTAIENEIGESGQGGNTINARLDALETAVGSGGSVDERIAAAETEIIGGASSDYNTLGKVEGELEDTYRKNETYSKTELDNLITTPNVLYVTVIATSGTTDVTTLLPATGAADTVYRVGNWDGTQYDPTMYALFAWNGTTYVCLAVRSFVGEVYDVSVNHPDGQGNPTPYADLTTALGTSGANIPADIRRGGMSIKFIQGNVQSSDNKYVQYRLMGDEWSTTVTDWQGVDDEPTAGSKNFVESGGVYGAIHVVGEKVEDISKEYVEGEGESIVVENDNNEEIIKIENDGVNAKNLKSNGIDLLEHIASEDAKKQDKVEGLSSENSGNGEESFEILDSYEQPVVRIDNEGLMVRSLKDINGNIIKFASDSCYISPNGNDSNSGVDVNHPMKTINKAFEKGFTSIILLGGVYNQTVDLTKANSEGIQIKGDRGGRVIFKKSDALICDSGEESLVSGYTKVYKLENIPSINYGNVEGRAEWLFFDGKEDVRTAISKNNAHPMQRGMFYRCDCTKSVKTTATTLASALNEIESVAENEYKWFYDNGTLYFNRPDATSVFPLYKSVGNYFISKENQSVILSNIEFRYGCVNLKYLNNVKVYNCSAKCVYGMGGFSYDFTTAIEFIRSEASLCFCGLNGDGFNAAAESSTADYRSIRNQALMIDCWSHDNNDDGYSDHEFGETTIVGGLFEYNKKGGVTPSFGSQCTCYNVYSRRNYSGFDYVGSVNDRGNEGQVICYGCIAEENNRGGEMCGFRVAHGNNRMILYNCLAINETTGYKADSGCYLDIFDCKTINCSTQKSGSGTINVYNGNIVQ